MSAFKRKGKVWGWSVFAFLVAAILQFGAQADSERGPAALGGESLEAQLAKISPELMDAEAGAIGFGDQEVGVIVQLEDSASGLQQLWEDRLTRLATRSLQLDEVADTVAVVGGRVKERYSLIHGLSARLPAVEILQLARHPRIQRISSDALMTPTMNMTRSIVGADLVQSSGVTGKGIAIAIIDSGIKPHKDFEEGKGSRIAVSRSFIDDDPTTDDRYGHGTHVAGIAAGGGPLYGGIAPGAKLVNEKVGNNGAFTSDVIEALDWSVANKDRYNIRVVNLSLGHPVFESFRTDPLCRAVERVVNAGIVVVVAAGNNGNSDGKTVYGGITSPGNDPAAVTVGATYHNGTLGRSDDTIAQWSSRGPTLFDGIIKPDLVAPGTRVVSTLAKNSYLAETYPFLVVDRDYIRLSGTSMATAVVSGTVALMLEKNPSLTALGVKELLMYTAEDMPQESLLAEGAGYLNAEGAVRLAGSISQNSQTTPVGDSWLVTDVTPSSVINGEKIDWSARFIWYNSVVWGAKSVVWGSVVWGGNSVVWGGKSVVWGDKSVVWGGGLPWNAGLVWNQGGTWDDPLIKYKHLSYSNLLVWAGGLPYIRGTPLTGHLLWSASSVVWGGHLTGTQSVVWGNQVLWNHSVWYGQSVVWGGSLLQQWYPFLVNPDSIVRANSVVWGGNSVVWGNKSVVWGGNSVVWGNREELFVQGENFTNSGYTYGEVGARYYPKPQ